MGTMRDMRVSLAAVIVAAVALLLLVTAGPGYRIGLFSLELALLGMMRVGGLRRCGRRPALGHRDLLGQAAPAA